MLLLVLAVTAALSVVVRHVIYPALSWNRDEATYLWQVRGLRAGQLLTTTGGLPQFFQPWLTGVRDGHFFSQYTLGWPGLMLVADVLFGSPAAAIVWGTVLAVLGTYAFTRELTRDHRLALVTAVLMLASPMVITQAGVYLGYLFSLGLGLLFGAALLVGDPARPALAARGARACSSAILFITRPFDAVLWAVAIGGYAIFITWREWPRQFRAAVLVFVGFLPLLMLTLAQNRIVTGSFTQFPFTAKEPLDKFGFGYRRLMPHIVGIHYTFVEAVKGTWSQRARPAAVPGRQLRRSGGRRGRALAPAPRSHDLAAARAHRRVPGRLLLVLGQPARERLRRPVGSGVLHPAVRSACASSSPPACSRCGERRRVLLIVLCCVLVVATVPFLYDASAMNHRISAAQEPWRAGDRVAAPASR